MTLTTLRADRLGALDAEFLLIDDGVGHMHLAGACVFEGPAPSFDELAALLEAKFHEIPRYRQRVRTVPLELGRPVWADDPHFDLSYHLRDTALPAPGDDAAFRRLMGRLMSQPLDRNRPLWEAWRVEGLEDDRWAMVFKVHHCMVDGIAGVGLLAALLDVSPDRTVGSPSPWEPAPEPGVAAKVLGAWQGAVEDARRHVGNAVSAVRHPVRAAAVTLETLRGGGRIAAELGATAPLTIDGSIGPHRVWAHSSVDLDDVRRIREAFGVTVNDVVLSALTAGYAALLRHHGDVVDEAVLRSLVPVSTRRADGEGVADNRVSLMLIDLPVAVADPLERLGAVRSEMASLKASHMVEAGEVVTAVGELAPPMIVGPISRWVTRVMHRLPQRSVSTVTTNVPGPQFPLYCLGRQMLAALPYVPITHGVRVGTAALSYNGRIAFGVTGDAGTVPDVAILVETAAREVAALRRCADDVLG